MQDFKDSFHAQLLNNRFRCMEEINQTLYIREDHPTLYMIGVFFDGSEQEMNHFFSHAELVERDLKGMRFTRMIALCIIIGRNTEIFPTIHIEKDTLHTIQWYFNPETHILLANEDQPTKLLKIEKMLRNALKEKVTQHTIKLEKRHEKVLVSKGLVLILFAIYIYTCFLSVGLGEVFRHYGLQYERVWEYGEWYRLITSMFLHNGLHHILSNILYLYHFGSSCEKVFGSFHYICLYLFSGICGGLLSLQFPDQAISVGASGAVYGLLGCTLLLAKKYGIRYTSIDYSSMVLLCCISIGLGFFEENINNLGHIGGFLGGILYTICRIHYLNKK